MPSSRPVVLCILDGWGQRADTADNAIAQANTPVWDRLMATAPHGVLDASELHVGLPTGQMGNSEVGHMNLGAGRVVMQDLPRIDRALADGSLAAEPEIARFVEAMKASGGTAHVMGLISPGGVHSHQDHIAGLVKILVAAGVPVLVHAFLDGRDTPPRSAEGYLHDFLAAISTCAAQVATVSGRFYAMDRDKRWDRVEAAWKAIHEGEGEQAEATLAAIRAAYERGETDEFVKPTVLAGYRGMRDGDGLLMGNFRADRAREILAALLDPAFDGFARPRRADLAAALGLVEYSSKLAPLIRAVYPPSALANTLGALVAGAGMRQLRIAETEKYAHVTFFFNGGDETVFPGEERILVPSPKVATYDLQPEMSAPEVTDRLTEAVRAKKFDLIVVNYANTDMVGHTGDLGAAIRAVEAVDACLGRLEAAVREVGGTLFITADHGNAEQMSDPATDGPHTAHTLNLVPAILVNGPPDVVAIDHGVLADVAPTLVGLLGLQQPPEMTGRSLLVHRQDQRAAGD